MRLGLGINGEVTDDILAFTRQVGATDLIVGPSSHTVEADMAAAAAPKTECFQGFCFESDPDTSLLSRWWDFSLTYLRLVTLGMVFAFLVAGVTEVFLFPQSGFQGFASRGIKGSLKGLLVGPAMNLCSACIVPVKGGEIMYHLGGRALRCGV